MPIETIQEIRGHYDPITNDPIPRICDYLIEIAGETPVTSEEVSPEDEIDEE